MPFLLLCVLAASLLPWSAPVDAQVRSSRCADGASTPAEAAVTVEPALSLECAVELALMVDPGVRGASLRADALSNEAIARGALPDPRISVMAGNLPVDNWTLDQEPMTQLSVGVQQAFPRGETLRLQRLQSEQRAQGEHWSTQDRLARVEQAVTFAWLDVFQRQVSHQLLLDNRVLFEQLRDVVSARYRSTNGGARQQDVLRAELEIARIDERLKALEGHLNMAREGLAEWVGVSAYQPVEAVANLSEVFPDALLDQADASNPEHLHALIVEHPRLRAVQQQVSASDTQAEIAMQGYKPAWSVEARYGYRADDAFGNERADLFSVALSFDVPLFTANRQDRAVSAETARAEAARTDYQILVRQWLRRLRIALDDIQQSEQRLEVFQTQLIPQAGFVAEAALNAYENDDGDFAEVVRARITELDLRIQRVELSVARAKAVTEARYLTTADSSLVSEFPALEDAS